MKAIHQNVLLITISGILALLIAETVVRTTLARPGFVQHEEPPELIVPHPSRHYTYNPGFTGEVITEEYKIRIDINSIGLRDDPITLNTEVDILAIGDSFTVGFGVDAGDAWPSQFESYLNSASVFPTVKRVVNAGVSGYNITQIRLLLQDLLNLDPKTVVLGLYPSRYWRIANPYVYLNGDPVLRNQVGQLRVVDQGFIRSPIHNWRFKQLYFWFAQNFYLGAYALEVTHQLYSRLERFTNVASPPQARQGVEGRLTPLLAEVGLISQLLRDRGVPFLVLLVNHQEPDGSFSDLEKRYNSVVKNYCQKNNIPVFDPLPSFESSASGTPLFRIGKDHHWSKEAHALVGRHLGAFLEQQDLFMQTADRMNLDSPGVDKDDNSPRPSALLP